MTQEELQYKMIVEMAEEISELRQSYDLEYGILENEQEYDIEKIIKDFYDYCKGDKK